MRTISTYRTVIETVLPDTITAYNKAVVISLVSSKKLPALYTVIITENPERLERECKAAGIELYLIDTHNLYV